jgi:phospholipid-binding lipoprotein MlaA
MLLNSSAVRAAFACAILAVAFLAGCATPPSDPEDRKEFDATNDPLEPTNRFFFGFNQTLDHGFIRPIALAYRDTVPEAGRTGVHNVVTNLREPWVFINDALQADADHAGVTFGRFFINSTIGLFGIFDVAGSAFNLPHRDNDAGLTLARWGAPDGPYLVLPLLGPSNPRDAVGIAAAFFLDPIDLYLGHHDLTDAVWAQTLVEALDTRTQYLDTLDSLERTSLDFYSTLRSITRQHREDQIKNKQAPGEPAPAQKSDAGDGGNLQTTADDKQ